MISDSQMSAETTILTIGHSNHTFEQFLALLRQAGVTAVADVRSSPFSQYAPQFDKDDLKDALRDYEIAYSFLGRELGGRPRERALFCNGVADYEKMAKEKTFREGLDRVIEGASRHRIALMCSERDPLDCHRCLLVARRLAERGTQIRHILASGEIVNHFEIEERLLSLEGLVANDLFATRQERLEVAYRARGHKVAFAEPDKDQAASVAAE